MSAVRTAEPPTGVSGARGALDRLGDTLRHGAGVIINTGRTSSIDDIDCHLPGEDRTITVWCHKHHETNELWFCTNGCRRLGRSTQVAEVADVVLRMLNADSAHQD